uniref:Lipoprotein cytochrome c n=1 Tax=Geobacter sulfurreducens (strain ATCC 51573 / DSM 12127 / PCA) TaxID=243231 RepID=UPI0037870BF0
MKFKLNLITLALLANTGLAVAADGDGQGLYAANCAACHGALATSEKKGTTLARLQSAVSANAGGMGFLSSLTSAQLQAIVDVLAVAGSGWSHPQFEK